ncbi:MAG: hypothetical protein L6425_03210 [Candidatus Aminicenantes bacterium]|nr:hypothetical protein [Candidatus Aminicenantes bacterium]
MIQIRKNKASQVITLVALVLFIGAPGFDAASSGSQGRTSIRISHTPVPYYVPGSRIQIKALVSDEGGIMLVRCYFRAKDADEFVFVDMPLIVGNEYIGIIPAPAAAAVAVEYLILAVNQNGLVVRSQMFEARRDSGAEQPAWQGVDMSGSVAVKTELARASQTIPGFSDNVTADVVESAFRFGYVVEGIYRLSQMMGAAPVGAVSGGTVSATTTQATPQVRTPAPVKQTPAPVRTPPQKRRGGISPVLIIGGVAVAAGAVLLATGAPGAKKVNVTIRVADAGSLDDEFDVYLDGELLGTTAYGGSGTWTESLKAETRHTLRVVNQGNGGTYCDISISNTDASAQDQPWIEMGASYSKSFTVNAATK